MSKKTALSRKKIREAAVAGRRAKITWRIRYAKFSFEY
jgi:hypothetical protein